jgi:hypothetical protein
MFFLLLLSLLLLLLVLPLHTPNNQKQQKKRRRGEKNIPTYHTNPHPPIFVLMLISQIKTHTHSRLYEREKGCAFFSMALQFPPDFSRAHSPTQSHTHIHMAPSKSISTNENDIALQAITKSDPSLSLSLSRLPSVRHSSTAQQHPYIAFLLAQTIWLCCCLAAVCLLSRWCGAREGEGLLFEKLRCTVVLPLSFCLCLRYACLCALFSEACERVRERWRGADCQVVVFLSARSFLHTLLGTVVFSSFSFLPSFLLLLFFSPTHLSDGKKKKMGRSWVVEGQKENSTHVPKKDLIFFETE